MASSAPMNALRCRAPRRGEPWAWALFAGLSLVPSVAGAQPYELKHDVPIDAAVTITAAALVFSSEAFGKADLAPEPCRWCDRDEEGNDTLNPVDRAARNALKWENTRLAASISDAIGFLGLPAASFGTLIASAGAEDTVGNTPLDMLLVGESMMLSGLLNQGVKLIAGRERPFVHALPDEEKSKTRHPTDNNLSFYSGHSSFTFSIAAASSTIASLRGYRLAPLVWATTGTLAATTAYLRIAADKHYLSDVLTGVTVGAIIGIAVPLVFHGRRATESPTTGSLGSSLARESVMPQPMMTTIGGSF